MMTSEQIIKTICPELSDSPSLSNYIQIAKESLSARFFGKLYNQAVAYKACHLFTTTKKSELNELINAGGGSVNHLQEGGISIGFNASTSDNELLSSKYGRMLYSLIKSRPAMTVNKNCRPVFPEYPILI